MLRIASVFLLSGLAQAIIDTDCTSGGVYTANAAICENTFSDTTCAQVFPGSDIVPGGSVERPNTCFNGTNGPDEDVKALAVANCPKTCGFCCQTLQYNCENVRMPRIQCNQITRRMCLDPTWRTIIAEDCPSSCGFCLDGGCVDAAPDCHLQPTICLTIGLESFVASNCQRTCGLCGNSTSATTAAGSVTTQSPGTTCVDNHRNCASWNRNGFCSSTFYSATVKAASCRQTCGLC